MPRQQCPVAGVWPALAAAPLAHFLPSPIAACAKDDYRLLGEQVWSLIKTGQRRGMEE